ncbi:MAG: adenylate/guanylate cyclase domain-containing protein [Armatimonadota bacterium]
MDQEQRTLASIMFTDVVGFSKLTAINEERTMRALHRDFDLIFRSVGAFKGEVLNTMGDGMMVYFSSATQCMLCALDIQQTLHALKMSNPPDGILSHRIGLNIGDIHLNGRNTMGDGVNQAARIQSMAKPDSIKMSAEFYKLVKDKVKMDAKYVPGQMAKNIPAPIPTYEVAAIDEMLKLQAAEALFTPPTAADGPAGATGRRAVLMLVLTLIMIGVAAVPVYMISQAQKNSKTGMNAVPKGRGDKFNLKKFGDQKATPEVSKTPTSPQDTNTPQAPVAFTLTPAEITELEGLRNSYDFDGAVALLQKNPNISAADGQKMLSDYQGLAAMKTWLSKEIDVTTQEKPLAALLKGSQADIYSATGGVVIATGGQVTDPKPLWELKPETIDSLGIACAALPPSGTPAPTEVTYWLSVFRTVFRLT